MTNMTAMAAATPPIDLSHFYSYTAVNRKPSSVKEFYKYFLIPGLANFAGGNNFFLKLEFKFDLIPLRSTTRLILPL